MCSEFDNKKTKEGIAKTSGGYRSKKGPFLNAFGQILGSGRYDPRFFPETLVGSRQGCGYTGNFFSRDGTILQGLNGTNVMLIPKKKSPTKIT